MFPRPAVWTVTAQPQPGLEGGLAEFGRWHTRVRGAKEVLGQVPVSCLAEEIETPGDGQIKALITVAGNPVLSTPGGHRLDEVLPQLDAMIAVDLWLNETTRHADVILPGLSPLEQPHHDDLILAFAINSVANYSAPVFTPEDPDRPEEWEILVRLTGLCAGMPAEDVDVAAIDDGFFDYLCFTQGLDGARSAATTSRRPGTHPGSDAAHRAVRRPLRREAGRADAGETEAAPNGINFGPMVSRSPRSSTPRQEDPAGPAVSARRPAAAGRRLEREPDELVLVSRRHLRSNNSWLHNVSALMKGRDRCTLLMHPTTRSAVACGGDDVERRSSAGRIEVPVEVTDAIKPGVVSMPHGWGHGKPGTRMSVANGSPGVNTNILSPPTFLDEPSGNGALNGIPVTVTRLTRLASPPAEIRVDVRKSPKSVQVTRFRRRELPPVAEGVQQFVAVGRVECVVLDAAQSVDGEPELLQVVCAAVSRRCRWKQNRLSKSSDSSRYAVTSSTSSLQSIGFTRHTPR